LCSFLEHPVNKSSTNGPSLFSTFPKLIQYTVYNNSLLDKAQQITMRNPCSHTMTILYQYSLCKKSICSFRFLLHHIDMQHIRSRYRSIYNLYWLLTKAISVILLIWLVDQDYFTKWIQRALNVYSFPQIHIACTCIYVNILGDTISTI
jgi:hypothetical protein